MRIFLELLVVFCTLSTGGIIYAESTTSETGLDETTKFLCNRLEWRTEEISKPMNITERYHDRFLANHILQKFYSRHHLALLNQNRKITRGRPNYEYYLSWEDYHDMQLYILIFNASFFLDVRPLVTPITKVCGHDNDDFGVTYGDDNLNKEIELCYDFSRFRLLYNIKTLQQLRFLQPHNDSLQIHEIYPNLTIERIFNRRIKYFTRIELRIPGGDVYYLPFQTDSIKVMISDCEHNNDFVKSGSQIMYNKTEKYGRSVFIYKHHLCDLIRMPGFYNYVDKVNNIILWYRNAILEPMTKNNQRSINVYLRGRMRIRNLHRDVPFDTFNLWSHYGKYFEINLKMFPNLQIEGSSDVVKLKMNHLSEEACFVEFINIKTQEVFNLTMEFNSMITVEQTKIGVNITWESIGHASITIERLDNVISKGHCIRGIAFTSLFKWEPRHAKINLINNLEPC